MTYELIYGLLTCKFKEFIPHLVNFLIFLSLRMLRWRIAQWLDFESSRNRNYSNFYYHTSKNVNVFIFILDWLIILMNWYKDLYIPYEKAKIESLASATRKSGIKSSWFWSTLKLGFCAVICVLLAFRYIQKLQVSRMTELVRRGASVISYFSPVRFNQLEVFPRNFFSFFFTSIAYSTPSVSTCDVI